MAEPFQKKTIRKQKETSLLRNSLAMTRAAFTLAEVLITLAIIGVVAAMTIPTVINKYREHVVASRLTKFYSAFNQAIEMSIAENGDILLWYQDLPSHMNIDENGQYTSEGLVWFNNYIGKHMKIIKTVPSYRGTPLFYLSNGTSFMMLNDAVSRDFLFFPEDYDKCVKKHLSTGMTGICAFSFMFYPTPNHYSGELYNKGLVPYFDGCYSNNIETLLNTKSSCTTRAIMLNGWKIPKNYPYKLEL